MVDVEQNEENLGSQTEMCYKIFRVTTRNNVLYPMISLKSHLRSDHLVFPMLQLNANFFSWPSSSSMGKVASLCLCYVTVRL